ncbi:MAG: pilus assembly protein PilM [Candidatus Omnitrophica bacterium]|jgi:type IV pilus assembly protein PilM|nr:pilus assembly protein PilM [Candidatus Omnitrophota bacterium]
MKFNLPVFKIKPKKKIIGLDIGSNNLRVVELEAKSDCLEITNFGIKDIRTAKDMPEAIMQLMAEAQITTKEINIGLSGESVVARHLSMPKMNEEELRKAIVYELEDHIPFKPEEVYLDFHIVGDDPNSPNKMRVFLVATKKDVLDSRVELLQKAGLEPKIITMDALALMNALYFNYSAKEKTNITLLNVGDKITNLLICREKIPYFVRDTRFGGEAITTLLETKLELDKKAAEELKYKLKDAPEETSKLIKTTLATLLNEIFVSIDFFENLTEQKIDEIYITGGSSQLWGLREFLGGYLGLEIIYLDPLKNFSFSPNIPREEIAKFSPYLSVAIGLALEEV